MASDDRSIGLRMCAISWGILAAVIYFLYENMLTNTFIRIALVVSLFCGFRGSFMIWKNPK